jgi:hypothetical protein
MIVLSLDDFSRNLDKYLKEVPGNDVVISKNDKPWIKIVSETAQSKTPLQNQTDGSAELKDAFGIWKDRDISLESIRKKAWARG